jgi:hypothetical protein
VSDKRLPIVYEVLNFLMSEKAHSYHLLFVDQMLLLRLAAHHGPKGIYPSIFTLAKALNISETYTKERIVHLESIGLIKRTLKDGHSPYIRGASPYYHLLFLPSEWSTVVDHLKLSTGQLQLTTSGQPQFHEWSTTVDTINIDNQNRRSVQRESAKKRAPLSGNFLPSKAMQELLKKTAERTSLSCEELMNKFRNVMRKKKSEDFNFELENFLISERPRSFGAKQLAAFVPTQPIDAAELEKIREKRRKEMLEEEERNREKRKQARGF